MPALNGTQSASSPARLDVLAVSLVPSDRVAGSREATRPTMGVELADNSERSAHERVDAAVVGVGSGREVRRRVPAQRVRGRSAVRPHLHRVGAELSGVELGCGGGGGGGGGGAGGPGARGPGGGGRWAALGPGGPIE